MTFPASRLLALALTVSCLTGSAFAQPRPGEHPFVFKPSEFDATIASSKPWAEERFLARHEAILRSKAAGPIDLVFLGDSITEGWTLAPDVWVQWFARYHPANFGGSGDSTQHVIWRIEHGEFDGIRPKVVVLLLGTNNTFGHTAAQIAAGNRRIVDLLRERIPGVKILLLAVWPRGERHMPGDIYDDGVLRNHVVRDLNALMARWDDGDTLRFLDLSDRFLAADGRLRTDLLPDNLHPNVAGYEVWARGIAPLLEEMMR